MSSSPHTNSTRPAGKLTQQLQQLRAELAANPRLQWGLAGILLIGITTGLLALDDYRVAELRQIASLRKTSSELHRQLGHSGQQIALQAQLDRASEQIDLSLWQFATPVIAQAEFNDWLNQNLQEGGARELRISQPTFRYFNPTAAGDASAPISEEGTQCKDRSQCRLIELRAQLRFTFDPATFPRTLAKLEAADHALRIEQITINSAERRVELTALTLARLSDAPEKLDASAARAASMASMASAASAAAASMPANAAASGPKPVVEVKW
ncbi:hypothetical protein SAMN02745857_03504 [Andreprevotia lacus DSM 23236]|jgi:hypothetical protein|uniref:Uncharacterized protein n=1 Tax=Andreprevotia lacus DSM 23236 TaxID=1121001 RepID=A0A1W1XYL4_9NEIS|nr:hypothetical protein [Andreprevotia lacus]SMC28954.1 hypothetical protein SAMN02745857_03504 [Andreprevotia lacus DSM 23236]